MHVRAGRVAAVGAGAVPDRPVVRAGPAAVPSGSAAPGRRARPTVCRYAVARCAMPVSPLITQPGVRDHARPARRASCPAARAPAAPARRATRAQVPLALPVTTTRWPAAAQLPGDGREPLDRPAPRRRLRAGMDDRDAARPPRPAGTASDRSDGSARHAVVAEQPAPATHLVLLLVPGRAVGMPGLGVGERPQLRRVGGPQQPVRLRAAAVQVDRHLRRLDPPGRRGQAVGRHAPGRRRRPARSAASARRARPAPGRGPGKRPAAPRRAGTAVARSPTPSARRTRITGTRSPSRRAMTSSRTAHPAGWLSANSTASATLAGSLRIASGPGLYCSSRSSKNLVRMPPGTTRVTPTCPASSAASARVKPTTPNFAAQ